MTTTAKTLLTLAATLAVAAPASAAQGGFDGSPWLAQLSGGAYVDFDLAKTPDHSTVTIDGKRAKVKRLSQDGEAFYRAVVSKPRLDAGERYKVTIKITPKSGKPF